MIVRGGMTCKPWEPPIGSWVTKFRGKGVAPKSLGLDSDEAFVFGVFSLLSRCGYCEFSGVVDRWLPTCLGVKNQVVFMMFLFW